MVNELTFKCSDRLSCANLGFLFVFFYHFRQIKKSVMLNFTSTLYHDF